MLWYIGLGEYSGGCIGSDVWREVVVVYSFVGFFILWKRRYLFVGFFIFSIFVSIICFFFDLFSGLVLNYVDIN